MKKIFISILVLVFIACFIIFSVSDVNANTDYQNKPFQKSVFDNASSDDLSYEDYRQIHEKNYPEVTINVDIKDFIYTNGIYDVEPYVDNFSDDFNVSNEGLYLPESGDVTFKVNADQSGYYNIKVFYYTVEGRSAAISKGIMINGTFPFVEAKNIQFSRVWKDEFNVSDKREKGKNDLKPQQEEVKIWTSDVVKDKQGLYNEAYQFYFNEGLNEITFTSNREPIVIGKIELFQEKELLSYEESLKNNLDLGYQKIVGQTIKIQGENAYHKSSPTLAPTANFSNYKVEPFVEDLTLYNTIGGVNWRIPGDWISWEVEVPKPGLYNLTFKVLQNFNRGMSSTRTLYINDEIPFEEVRYLTFDYDSDWQNVTLGGEEPYFFYLKEGKNTIKLEANIGVYGPITRNVQATIADLRGLYREVVMKTGLNPDPYQDYLLSRYIPDLYERIQRNIDNLKNAKKQVINIAGERTQLISTFDRTLLQLKRFMKSEKNIQNSLREFEQNLSSLGSWVMSVSEQPLLIDYIQVHDEYAKLPNVRFNFLEKIWHQLKMFIASFKNDGGLNSNVKVDGPTITVWISTGKDQAKVLRQLIDESFTVDKNINVNLKLVSPGALLPATLSGNGPDISIGVGENLPVNWGIRNAIQDLTVFEDFDTVSKSFHESALTPYTFQNKVYALPDTQDFLVTFYREDILNDIGITEIPKTWNDVIDMLPVLQKNYLDFYLPNNQGSLNPVLYSMILQNGGSLYLEEGKYSGMMEEESAKSFVDFTKYYVDYGFVLYANFVNRFRSGEMPIGVSYYTDYNTLSVFATEINGLWSYAPIPGTKQSDGAINNYSTSRTTATVMMSNSKEKEAAWEYMKWWLGDEAQLNYARNMEAILGAAARYPTANLKAFENLPWPTKDYMVLKEQREKAKGIPVVPGDYIVGRYIDNAFRAVINDDLNPYDSLYNYHVKINRELERKRKEFGY